LFKIDNLTVKNFMSVGNSTQAIDFNRDDLTLVLGENLDTGGGDAGSRNGTGKTTIINALSYALFGNALTNIRRDNLVNKTNSKNMLVTCEFELEGLAYRVERGRKPNVLKFYINNTEQESNDNAQGDSRETQKAIEELLGMSHDMFKHVVALNTYTEPFLSMKANDQRAIIEQLLGITLLSEKADSLKEQLKTSKEMITQEEYNIKSVADANARIEDQVESLKRRQKLWKDKHNTEVSELETAINELSHIDIDVEINLHSKRKEYKSKQRSEKEASGTLVRLQSETKRNNKIITKLQTEITSLENHKCYACGQEIHDETQQDVIKSKKEMLQEAIVVVESNTAEEDLLTKTLDDLGEIGELPTVFYESLDDAYNHRSSLDKLESKCNNIRNQTDPYQEQIQEMQDTAIVELNYNTLNELVRVKEHQEFLQKLLTSKDSFIRKRIIDQNLAFLNKRLAYYLERIGLPHAVVFQNDLTVEITELGRDLDFDNLSRGERNRLILSMSWAFRDVWENLYQPINLLFIDELVDSGMDASGVENSLAILKKISRERKKSVWLVSHKDELAGRVNNILTVTKENGFTSYNTDVEIV
jgi:DNA repair exonuclease SbcCD ATPase subunit